MKSLNTDFSTVHPNSSVMKYPWNWGLHESSFLHIGFNLVTHFPKASDIAAQDSDPDSQGRGNHSESKARCQYSHSFQILISLIWLENRVIQEKVWRLKSLSKQVRIFPRLEMAR